LIASQAGLVTNLKDGMAWGLFPLFFASAGMSLFTGAWSDRAGRKGLIVAGMWLQGVGILMTVLSGGFWGFAVAAMLMGTGTAMVYPTLMAAVSDVAHPSWRASSVGIYRLWRDSGYAIGAVAAGVIADLLGLEMAIWIIGAVALVSGLIVAVRMSETLREKGEPAA